MEYTEVDVKILGETVQALRVTDGDRECWITKRLIKNLDDDWEIGDTETMEIPEWLAENEELV
jgi:hypothetical protein